MPRRVIAFLSLISLALVYIGCSPQPTPTPVFTPTPRPTRTLVPPVTLKPPPTRIIPTATSMPTATDEPSPEPSAVATSKPASNPSGGGGAAIPNSGLTVWTMAPLVEYFSKIGPTTQQPIARPANVDPLTGLEVDPAMLARRPVLARIGNDPSARPIHAGFNQADLVFEEMIDQRNMVFAVTP